MNQALLINSESIKRHYYVLLLIFLFCIQKTTAATYYVNDSNTKGDIYTSAIGSDSNDGISAATPKRTIKAAYELAKDGDSIIIDTGSYNDLSEKGKVLFTVSKRITFTIGGIANPVFSKIRVPKNELGTPAVFYIVNDKPVDRETYLQAQNGGTKKSQ